MATDMKDTYDLTHNGDNTMNQIVKTRPLLSGQGEGNSVGTIAMDTPSNITSTLDATIQQEIRMGTLDPNMDMKSMRRIISNRYAAKKSHIKKVNKMIQLENNRRDLENTVAALRPQIEHEWQLRLRLRIENEMLAKKLQFFTDLKNMKEGEIAEKRMEIQWLKGLLNMKVQQQADNGGTHGVGLSRLL